MNYPEHEKLKQVQEQSQWLGEFREWLGEQGIYLAKHSPEDEEHPRLVPVHESTNQLLARYFEIDLIKIEQEKRQMIEECQKLNTKK